MEIRDIIIKENIKAKKNYGQNFLVDQNILKKIVESTNLENQNIIEIGPGLGSLTDFLAQKAKKLVCYEIDKDMIAVLSKRFDKNEKINIIHQDFLKIDIQKEIEKKVDLIMNASASDTIFLYDELDDDIFSVYSLSLEQRNTIKK